MLISMGWKLWLKDKKGKLELRYTKPKGKTYISLYTACKGYMEERGSYSCSNQKSKRKKKAAVPVIVGHEAEISSRQSKTKKASTVPATVGHGPENSSSTNVRRSTKASRHVAAPSHSHNIPKTVLNLLIDQDVLLPREKVFYCHGEGRPAVKEGRVTRQGIRCECCRRVLSIADFKAHSGGNSTSSGGPASNIFLQDGRSLLQCQLQLVPSDVQQRFRHVRVKADFSSYYTDEICSVCQDGGSLMICDHCPSAFHPGCIGLEDVPQGDWFCHRCRCTICGSSEFQHDKGPFTEKTILYCDQCERGYHVGCLGEGDSQLTSCLKREWLCNTKCSTIFHHLRDLVGKRNPTSVEGLSWTLLRSSSRYSAEDEIMVEHHSKLHLALDVLHECFITIIEPRTRSDFVADLLFNKESELNRLNFPGFYTMLLERGDELISVATLRVFGERIAEMPRIGTRLQHHRQGMCLLVSELEKLLCSSGAKASVTSSSPTSQYLDWILWVR